MIFRPDLVHLNDFDYILDKDKIANFPLENRDSSKLLIADSHLGAISDDCFSNITDYLPADSLLVINSTKVIAARLILEKPTGGAVELLCVSPLSPSPDPQITVAAKQQCSWQCIVGGRNVYEGMLLVSSKEQSNRLTARIVRRLENEAIVEFNYSGEKSFSEILLEYGVVPLPPYIKREATPSDTMRYQTVYSIAEGSVAAPTAGLHFTDKILAHLANKNITKTELILHVGPGTFKPISNEISFHNMHKELFFASVDLIKQVIDFAARKKDLIATGTTSLRTLESLYWIGLKSYYEPFDFARNELFLDQFEPYELSQNHKLLTMEQAFTSLLANMELAELDIISGETKLFILPGYEIQTANYLITNFHLPKSTLLLLVSAFVGEDMRKSIYAHALDSNYRFLSYGDSSLLKRGR